MHYICFHNNDETFNIVMSYIESIVQINNTDQNKIKNFLLSKNDDDYTPFHLAVYKGNLVYNYFFNNQ